MENNDFHDLNRSELDKYIDNLLNDLKSRSSSEQDDPERERISVSQIDAMIAGLKALSSETASSESSETAENAESSEEAEVERNEAELPEKNSVPDKEQAEALLERVDYRKRYRRMLISTISSLVIVVAAAIFIAVVLMPVIRVSGGSMDPVYRDGDILVLLNSKNYSSGQLCCVSWHNKLLLKRVIGMSGDTIDIDENGNVYVNGEQLDEPYTINKCLGECDIELPYQVPEGQLFVMGDRRDTSVDSRSTTVGCVDEGQIVGRVLFRVWPMGNS